MFDQLNENVISVIASFLADEGHCPDSSMDRISFQCVCKTSSQNQEYQIRKFKQPCQEEKLFKKIKLCRRHNTQQYALYKGVYNVVNGHQHSEFYHFDNKHTAQSVFKNVPEIFTGVDCCNGKGLQLKQNGIKRKLV